MICCPLQDADGNLKCSTVKVVTGRKDHRCDECREVIPRGAKREHMTGIWEDSWMSHDTCLSCVEIRDHFSCAENSGVLGELWSDLEENFFPDMKAGGPCMEGLSPEAKNRLFERRMQWLLESAE